RGRGETHRARRVVRLRHAGRASAPRLLDFFDRQERSRRTSRVLVVAFGLSFAAVVAATTALVAFVVYLYSDRSSPLGMSASFGAWVPENLPLLGAVAVATLGIMLIASAYRAASLAGGGGQVARMLGGTEVPSDATDLPRKRLLNVVEEMSIASGLPRP